MPLHDEQDEDQEKEHEVYGGEKSDKEGETDTEEYEEHGGDESVAAAGDEELEPVSGSKKRIKEIEEEEEDSRKAKAENEMGSAKERRKRPSSLTHVVKSLNNRSNFNQDPSHASLSAYWSYSSSSGSEYEGLIRPGELLLKYLHKDIKPEHVKEFFSGLGVGDNDVIWGRADEEDDDSDEEYITDDGEYITDDGEYNEDSGTDDEEGDKDNDNDVEKSQNVIDKGLLCLVKFGPSSNLKEIRGRLQGEPILGIPVCIGWNGNSRSILFISGFERKLSEKVIRQKIRRKFVKCGKVLKIFIPKKDETSLGFCYVLYDGDLKKAFDMDLTMMEGSTIHVRSAELKKKICVAHFE